MQDFETSGIKRSKFNRWHKKNAIFFLNQIMNTNFNGAKGIDSSARVLVVTIGLMFLYKGYLQDSMKMFSLQENTVHEVIYPQVCDGR